MKNDKFNADCRSCFMMADIYMFMIIVINGLTVKIMTIATKMMMTVMTIIDI